MDHVLYKSILEEFIPSQEMKEHFLQQDLPTETVVDLILGSITSLDTKLEWIRKIHEAEPSADTEEVIKDVEDALAYLEVEHDGRIFTVEETCVSSKTRQKESSLACPAKDRWGVEESICQSDDECWPWTFPAWWEVYEWWIPSWDKREDGFGSGEYQFLYAKTENDYAHSPVFFIRWYTKTDDTGQQWLDFSISKERRYRYSGGGEGRDDLSIPFCPGDIISVWGLPFENKRIVLLLSNEPGKHYALDFDNEGKERIVNLSHGKYWLQELHGFGVSAIYRMQSNKGLELPAVQLERFKHISAQIAGNNEKGLALVDKIMTTNADAK